jgi:hypothetical protein
MTADQIDRLNVRSGDVLILRGTTDVEAMHGTAQDLRRALYARNLDDVTILVLAPDTQLDVLDEATMATAGWVKKVAVPVAANPLGG